MWIASLLTLRSNVHLPHTIPRPVQTTVRIAWMQIQDIIRANGERQSNSNALLGLTSLTPLSLPVWMRIQDISYPQRPRPRSQPAPLVPTTLPSLRVARHTVCLQTRAISLTSKPVRPRWLAARVHIKNLSANYLASMRAPDTLYPVRVSLSKLQHH